MSDGKLRHRLAWEAARLMYAQKASEYSRAKKKAARRLGSGQPKPNQLPTNREIRDHLEEMARIQEDHFQSCSAGNPMEQASIADLERLLAVAHPDPARELAAPQPENRLDRFLIYRMLLLPLEQVKENPKYCPEGDTLYHSLQVFELAREQIPYDEEFLLAALLHDVGKAIDLQEHTAAGLDALDGSITPRTAWLIEHYLEIHALTEGVLGVRSRRRLEASEDFEQLKLLAMCDRQGHQRGVQVPDVDDALGYLRELATSCGE
jgi:hypothetical protein